MKLYTLRYMYILLTNIFHVITNFLHARFPINESAMIQE